MFRVSTCPVSIKLNLLLHLVNINIQFSTKKEQLESHIPNNIAFYALFSIIYKYYVKMQ